MKKLHQCCWVRSRIRLCNRTTMTDQILVYLLLNLDKFHFSPGSFYYQLYDSLERRLSDSGFLPRSVHIKFFLMVICPEFSIIFSKKIINVSQFNIKVFFEILISKKSRFYSKQRKQIIIKGNLIMK